MSMQNLHGAKPSSVGHGTNEKPGATRSPTIWHLAHKLGLSIGTVKVNLHNIMKKLGTHNRVQALAHLSPGAAVGQ